MKKALTLFALTVVLAVPAFATYIVVLKDGTRYAAKAKWTVTNGKALVLLENGQSLQLDPSLIDAPRSEQLTKIGAGANANVIDLNTNAAPAQAQQPKREPTLGEQIRLRRTTPQQPAPTPAVVAAPVSNGAISAQVLDKFDRAFENLGIFEKKLTSTGPNSLRADLTLDTEDRVFNAISATSLLITRNAGVEGARIDVVELFMKTTVGGAAGRFQMNRADAEALDKRQISQQEYFVRKVIY
jgi:hypothetical protein